MNSLRVGDTEVLLQGSGDQVVLMLHGWPDTQQLWDGTVQALQGRYRCVRFTLPGFDAGLPARAVPLDALMQRLAEIADATSPDRPVTLLIHDWGCIFGYEFAARYPQRVARIVAVDIGDYNTGAYQRALSARAKLQILGYQWWLALAWQLGRFASGALAARMTRWMARAMRCPAPPQAIQWQMNYPYAMTWMGTAGGLGRTAPVRLQCPTLYLYGERKPFMFHSPQWLAQLAAHPPSQARGFATGHWIMLGQPEAFHACVQDWLAATDAP